MTGKRPDSDRMTEFLMISTRDGDYQKAAHIKWALQERFPSLQAVFKATRAELMQVPGMDDDLVTRIHAVRGLAQGGYLPKAKIKPPSHWPD